MKFLKGNIFNSEAKILLNPVNTEGVMGKGLAYQFKKKFPLNYEQYRKECLNGNFDVGKETFYTEEKEKIIVNFPTKREWRKPSKIEYISKGLVELEKFIIRTGYKSVAIPPLGAGNGGLDWNKVKEEIIKFSERLDSDIEIIIYEPDDSIKKITDSHYLMSKFISGSNNLKLKSFISDMVFQKVLYLYGFQLKNNYFKFYKGAKGPFSKTINIIYKELKEYKNINQIKTLNELEIEYKKTHTSKNLEEKENSMLKTLNLFEEMIKDNNIKTTKELEDTLEQFSTVLYLVEKNNSKLKLEDLENEIITWSKRKIKLFEKKDLESILNYLIEKSLIKKDLFGNYNC